MSDIVEMLRDKARRLSKISPSAAKLSTSAADEIERLRTALRACAADYISEPCTVAQGASLVAGEFSRRMEIAARALHPSVTVIQEQ